MFNNIKVTIKHSFIYGLGNISYKLVGIILLPLYTSYISVSEYGLLGIIEITVMILNQVLIFGLPQAYLRFYDIEEYGKKHKELFSTIIIFLFLVSLLFISAAHIFSSAAASIFENPEQFEKYILLSGYIIVLRVITTTLLNVFRAQNKSSVYVIGNLAKVFVTLILNVYFIAVLSLGITGILYAYIIGEIALMIVLLPGIFSLFSLTFNGKILKPALYFGIPLLFSSIAHMLLNIGDRYILKYLVNYHEVGLYELGYRFAGILNTFLIQSFALGLLPIAYKLYQKPGDKRYYSKIMTYYFFVICWSGLALSLFAEDLIKLFTLNQEYWNAYSVVPLIVLGYIFSGANTVAGIGLHLTRKTGVIAVITTTAMLLNVTLNFILVPYLQMYGSAIATIAAFFVLFILTYYYSNRSYSIPYEKKKLFIAVAMYTLLYLIYFAAPSINYWLQVSLKVFIIFLFPITLFFFNYYEEVELSRIRQLICDFRDKEKRNNLLRKIFKSGDI